MLFSGMLLSSFNVLYTLKIFTVLSYHHLFKQIINIPSFPGTPCQHAQKEECCLDLKITLRLAEGTKNMTQKEMGQPSLTPEW